MSIFIFENSFCLYCHMSLRQLQAQYLTSNLIKIAILRAITTQ